MKLASPEMRPVSRGMHKSMELLGLPWWQTGIIVLLFAWTWWFYGFKPAITVFAGLFALAIQQSDPDLIRILVSGWKFRFQDHYDAWTQEPGEVRVL